MNALDKHEDDRPRPLNLQTWAAVIALAGAYRRHAAGLAAVAVAIAACEITLPLLTGRLIDIVTRADGAGFGVVAGAYGVVAVVLCAAICGYILLAGRIATGVSHDIREASFAKLQQLPFAYYDRHSVGWLMSRLTSDCDRLSRIIGWTLLDFLWAGVMIVGIAVTMFWLQWQLALVVLAVVPPLAVLSLNFQRRMLDSARAVRKSNAEITAAFNEGIMGVRTSKALVRERENLAEFSAASGRMYEHSVRNALQSALYVPLVLSLGSLATGLALWYGGGQVLLGTLSIGTLVTFMNYASLFFEPVQQAARQLTEVQMAQAAAERILNLLRTEVAIRDADEVQGLLEQADRHRAAGKASDGGDHRIETVEFRDVCFAYDRDHLVLQNFQLHVAAGQTIALVGPTGAGKSTVVSLLCRFYEPTAGEILINGVDFRQRSLHWLQSNLGIVLQTPHLFSGSIRENIRYGNLQASDGQIAEAARLVNADRFIEQLPDGYGSDVGEGGNRLSTGQKQLVALARAILADPQIFILDEATSSVDTETEQLIQLAVERVMQGRISFVIAHRLSTIRSADRILVIDDGRLVESGKHEELLRQRGRYFHLYMHQFADQWERQGC